MQQFVDVAVPVRTAYDQLTRIEVFPEFMEDVVRVEQLDDTTARWHVEVAGVERSFDTRITEQTTDQRIAWTTLPDAETEQTGVVTFQRLGDDRTRVTLQIGIDPDSVVEKFGHALGIIERTITRDLQNFKAFIERCDEPTGAWRGEVGQHAES